MIRILHIIGSLNMGGIQTFLMSIYRNIDREKIQFDFLVGSKEPGDFNEEIKKLGGRIYSITPRKEGIKKNHMSLCNFFKEHNEYKIVHQHVSSLSNITPLKIAKKYGVPIRIVHSHNIREGGRAIHKFIHKWNQLFIKSYATDFFACSDLAAKWLFPKNQYKKKEYVVIPNAIDVNKFVYNQMIRDEYRKLFNLDNKFVVGHVGRFHPQKNHGFVIDVFLKIFQMNPQSMLVLVGEGDLRVEFEEKVKKLGLVDSVLFLGTRSDVSNLFQAMDSFLFPSLYEGLGIVLVEAQAAGLHCVTSKNVVPEDVNVSDLVDFLPLTSSPDVWANTVLKHKDEIRYDREKGVKNAGYDIFQVTKEMQERYEEKSCMLKK